MVSKVQGNMVVIALIMLLLWEHLMQFWLSDVRTESWPLISLQLFAPTTLPAFSDSLKRGNLLGYLHQIVKARTVFSTLTHIHPPPIFFPQIKIHIKIATKPISPVGFFKLFHVCALNECPTLAVLIQLHPESVCSSLCSPQFSAPHLTPYFSLGPFYTITYLQHSAFIQTWYSFWEAGKWFGYGMFYHDATSELINPK